jgi:hypothetical protein
MMVVFPSSYWGSRGASETDRSAQYLFSSCVPISASGVVFSPHSEEAWFLSEMRLTVLSL